MADVRAIEFNEALSRLQGLIGAELQIITNFYGKLCAVYLTGRLAKIDTLSPDDAAVNLVIEGRGGIIIDPAEVVEILLAGDLDGDGSLSLYLPSEIAIQIERAPSH
jgi:intein/homing endonuclease